MLKTKKTWILIADGAKARVLIKHKKSFDTVAGSEMVGDHRKNTDALSERPGRGFQSMGNIRHGYEEKHDWHEYQKHLFAREVSMFLDKACENKDFDNLVLIAPAKTLGELRADLGKNTQEKVSLEISKDLTNLNQKDLEAFLEAELI